MDPLDLSTKFPVLFRDARNQSQCGEDLLEKTHGIELKRVSRPRLAELPARTDAHGAGSHRCARRPHRLFPYRSETTARGRKAAPFPEGAIPHSDNTRGMASADDYRGENSGGPERSRRASLGAVRLA